MPPLPNNLPSNPDDSESPNPDSSATRSATPEPDSEPDSVDAVMLGDRDVNDIPLSELPPLPNVELPLLNDPLGYEFQSWSAIVMGAITFAVAAGVIMAVGTLVMSIYIGSMPLRIVWEFAGGIFGGILGGGLVGLLIGGVVGAFCVALFWALNFSLGKPIPRRICAVSAAGLTAYLPLSIMIWLNIDSIEVNVVVWMLLLGPLLGTIVISLFVGFYMDRYGAFYDETRQHGLRLRIKIRQLLAITVWGAAVFAITNAIGQIELSLVVLLWIVIQVPILVFEHYFRKWRAGRFERRMRAWPYGRLDIETGKDVSGPVF